MTRYIKIFDEDRSDLASAYSHNAVFSCRVHELNPATTRSEAFTSKLTCSDTSGKSLLFFTDVRLSASNHITLQVLVAVLT